MADNKYRADAVAVIGLGRFGGALAIELVGRDIEVLGVDSDSRIVQQFSGQLTHVVCADSTDPEALTQLGVAEFGRAVVGIGNDIEASILTTSVLADLEVPDIWAKSISLQHSRILQRVGAHHVVQPEHDMGERVAHLVTGRMLDYLEVDEGYALIKTKAPGWADGKTLGALGIRKEYGVTVVGIKKPGSRFTYATSETLIRSGDTLLVAGETDQAERFAEET
ncbi:trk system potassium uptake protein TrkA [Streptosporangium becharense]|uniref:Trk system potassium uptake protein TrkA n=1 Tax=Streptosporangium becharense TaxID=1816182 RepID=A0A7W9MFH7_9ACTN|nr:TrkA family potassium uptake protein [Streptosporangium becharense]MBB2912837.1 trk system potassium uptake protein TrkA [Streptosporangium becharense]MBB5818338.1 trk system potassium uptake protein TrkA [Streptosporangium becharense]